MTTARIEQDLRAAAFRRLFTSAAPVAPGDIAAEVGCPTAEAHEALGRLARAGRIRVDRHGLITGSCGLSVEEDRHSLDIQGRRFWTWCTYDVLGIMGALGASGRAYSVCPGAGRTIEVAFERGAPQPADVVLFRPDPQAMATCANVYEQWCPLSNFFLGREAATTWAALHGVEGSVRDLVEASHAAAAEWSEVVGDLAAVIDCSP